MLFVLLFLVCGSTLNGISGIHCSSDSKGMQLAATAGRDEQVVVEAVVGKYSIMGRMWERIPEKILEGVKDVGEDKEDGKGLYCWLTQLGVVGGKVERWWWDSQCWSGVLGQSSHKSDGGRTLNIS